MRKASTIFAILATLLVFAFALGTPASADPNGPGTNGTVKVVNDSDDPIGADDRDNDPHVCHYHLYGFHFDNGSSGTWMIESWAPTGNGSVVASGTWTADGTGQWAVAGTALADGHYKLFAKQTAATTPGGDKQKVFWVACGTSGATGGTETGGTQAGGAQGNTTQGNTGTTTTCCNGITIFTPAQTNGGAVRGFESAPNSNAVGAVSPIVELPGGSNQLPSNAVQGVQSAPLAGIQSLPSTSTQGSGAPLAFVGLAFIGLGGALLRRSRI